MSVFIVFPHCAVLDFVKSFLIFNFTKFLSKIMSGPLLCIVCTVWKNMKFSITAEKFRQINSLVTYLVKPLI